MNDQFQTQKISQESGEPTGEKATYWLTDDLKIELDIPELEDINHPLVPEVNQDYLVREINGTTDIKLLSFVMEDQDYFAMLEGEAGVGKNMSIKTVCAAGNWPMIRTNFSVGTSYQSLVGRYAPVEASRTEEETVERSKAVRKTATRLYSENEDMDFEKALELASNSLPSGSSFQWVDGLLTRAVKYGWVFVADEINAAEDEAIMPLNGLTEDRESRYLTIEEKSEVIEPHPRFRFIATRNPISYAGVSEMNSALESRSYIIEYGYHEEEAVQDIVSKRSNIVENEGETALEKLVELAGDIRLQEQSDNGNHITKVSTRDLIKVGRLTDIMGIRKATETVLLGIADPTDEQSIKEMINSTRFRQGE
jgi:MoxR-like ATPase